MGALCEWLVTKNVGKALAMVKKCGSYGVCNHWGFV